MNRFCPSCHGANVRRSSTAVDEITWRNHFLSRYRCRECLAQFWVISQKAYVVAANIAGAIALAVVAYFLLEITLNPQTSLPGRRQSEAVPQQHALAAAEAPSAGCLQPALLPVAPGALREAFSHRESWRT